MGFFGGVFFCFLDSKEYVAICIYLDEGGLGRKRRGRMRSGPPSFRLALKMWTL